MSVPNIGSTQPRSVSGLAAPLHLHHKRELDESTGAALVASTDSSATSANPLASAIATSLTQLGLTFTPGHANADNPAAASKKPLAPLPQQLKGSQQVQQYRNIAATFSNLAQAVSSSSSSTSAASSGASGLATVFQDLWSSLSASSGTSVDATSSTVPSLQSFVQTLARNFSESGISDLRGVFVDTIV